MAMVKSMLPEMARLVRLFETLPKILSKQTAMINSITGMHAGDIQTSLKIKLLERDPEKLHFRHAYILQLYAHHLQQQQYAKVKKKAERALW